MSPASHGSDDGGFSQEVGTQTLKAVILITVAVLIAVLLLHREGSSSPGLQTSSPSTAPTTVTTLPQGTTSTTAPAPIPPAQVKVRVLNGTSDTKGSFAGEYTAKLKAAPLGYATLSPDNTTAPVSASAIWATNTEYVSEGQALAASLGLPVSVVLNNIPAGAPIKSYDKTQADLILVVGQDLASKLPGASSSTTTGTGTATGGVTTTTTSRTKHTTTTTKG